jgi:hypothetical protein
MCDEINKLKQELNVLWNKVSDPKTLRIEYSNFEPNEEMNDSFFIEETA